MKQDPTEFVDDHNQVVAYDGSPVTWRMSAQAIIERNDSILLIKDRRQNFFSSPGGALEVHEEIEEALQREMLEEVGTPVKVGNLLFAYQDRFFHRGNKRFSESMIFFFQADLDGELGVPQDPNTVYARFIPYAELTAENLNRVVYEVLKNMGRIA